MSIKEDLTLTINKPMERILLKKELGEREYQSRIFKNILEQTVYHFTKYAFNLPAGTNLYILGKKC